MKHPSLVYYLIMRLDKWWKDQGIKVGRFYSL